jgi:hypothetical protein
MITRGNFSPDMYSGSLPNALHILSAITSKEGLWKPAHTVHELWWIVVMLEEELSHLIQGHEILFVLGIV